MGKKKLLQKLGEFFDPEVQNKKRRRKELKEVLKKLKKKERELISKCIESASSKKQERCRIEKEIDIVHAQRKKGVALLKEWKQTD